MKSRPRARSASYWKLRYQVGLVAVAAIGQRRDRGHAGIRLPGDPRAAHRGIEVEGRVLVVQRMVVAPGKQRTHDEARPAAVLQTPAQHHLGPLVAGDDLLADLRAVGGAKGPPRPGLGGEAGDPLLAVGIRDVRRVALGAEREAAGWRLEPHLDPVHQHHAPGRRRGRSQQQRMIAPRPDAGDGPRGEPAQTIGLEPLGIEQSSGQGLGHRLGPPPLRRCARDRHVGSGTAAVPEQGSP